MATFQVWLKKEDKERLDRLVKFYRHESEVERDKNIERLKNLRKTGERFRDRTLRDRLIMAIKNKEINESQILRDALESFWADNQEAVLEFEKQFQ